MNNRLYVFNARRRHRLPGVPKRANNSGVTLFTAASVHWSRHRITATVSVNGSMTIEGACALAAMSNMRRSDFAARSRFCVRFSRGMAISGHPSHQYRFHRTSAVSVPVALIMAPTARCSASSANFALHSRVFSRGALDGEVLCLIVGQTQITRSPEQSIFCFLQMVDGLVDFLNRRLNLRLARS